MLAIPAEPKGGGNDGVCPVPGIDDRRPLRGSGSEWHGRVQRVALSPVWEHHRFGNRGEPTTAAGSEEAATEAAIGGINPKKDIQEDCR